MLYNKYDGNIIVLVFVVIAIVSTAPQKRLIAQCKLRYFERYQKYSAIKQPVSNEFLLEISSRFHVLIHFIYVGLVGLK